MKYTSFFSRHLKSSGIPHLNPEMFALYMNVVHLEGKMSQLDDLIKKCNKPDLKNIYAFKKVQIKDKVEMLTEGKEPEHFIYRLIKSSV